MAKILKTSRWNDVLQLASGSGMAGVAPRRAGERCQWSPVTRADEIDFDAMLPTLPLKSLLFPPTQKLFGYERSKSGTVVSDINDALSPTLVIGARPCDAGSVPILEKLFNWDVADSQWNARRAAITIVSIACTKSDAFCMCRSVGGSPKSSAGSDVLLTPTADGSGYVVEAVSDKGCELVESWAAFLVDGEAVLATLAEVTKRFSLDRVRAWLDEPANFDSPFWRAISSRCIGCGACTYVCPTCHCFDIQDEGDAYAGVRCRNWDSCSFANFTQHTSGHNPRGDRASRWRQRIVHKFSIYPKRFGCISCTGCGRCVRQCPVDMGIVETLERIDSM